MSQHLFIRPLFSYYLSLFVLPPTYVSLHITHGKCLKINVQIELVTTEYRLSLLEFLNKTSLEPAGLLDDKGPIMLRINSFASNVNPKQTIYGSQVPGLRMLL